MSTLVQPPTIYYEDVELFKLTGIRSNAVVPYFTRSASAAGLLSQLKSGSLSSAMQLQFLAQLGSNLSNQNIPTSYKQLVWDRARYLANVSGPNASVTAFASNPAAVLPSSWGDWSGPAPALAPDPGPSDPSLFPPYTAPAPVTPAGNELGVDCRGTYPTAKGQRCQWPHPDGYGASVILDGPPGPLTRSFRPCPPGYAPDPVTGYCVAFDDALWKLYYPNSNAPATTTSGVPNGNANLTPLLTDTVPAPGATGPAEWVDGTPIPGTVAAGPSNLPGPGTAPMPTPALPSPVSSIPSTTPTPTTSAPAPTSAGGLSLAAVPSWAKWAALALAALVLTRKGGK